MTLRVRSIDVVRWLRRLEQKTPKEVRVWFLVANKWFYRILHWVQPSLQEYMTPPIGLVVILVALFWWKKNVWYLLYAFQTAVLSLVVPLGLKWMGFISEEIAKTKKARRRARQELPPEASALLFIMRIQGTIYGLRHMYATRRYPRAICKIRAIHQDEPSSSSRDDVPLL